MNDEQLPRLDGQDLIRMAGERLDAVPGDPCANIVCPGWESLPASLDRSSLRRVGTLREAAGHGIDEPTYFEHHPAGTHSWSAEAPIALGFFPYNRSDVWVCVACARPFLRYTEAGGYYEEERIREVDASLVIERPGAV